MANAVLSSVGSAVGGSFGSALGGYAGRQLDRQLGSLNRTRGITDLRVQGSNYGADIPVIVGRMRVAGTIIWASDLVEGFRASKTAGQNTRSVSFAVAFSSAKIARVERIWADGRLIRGSAGDHKIDFELRLLEGSEDQDIDPLIASFEGVPSTPAYRGLSILVFEDFDLGSFGNRLPQINIEVQATDVAPTVSELFAAVLRIDRPPTGSSSIVRGIALQGENLALALAPTLELFRPKFAYRSATWSVEEQARSHTIRREDVAALPITPSRDDAGPQRITVRYFDESLDYGVGEKASAREGKGRTRRIAYPGLLRSDDAKALAQQHMHAAFSERSEVSISLPIAKGSVIGTGDIVKFEGEATSLRVCAKTIGRQQVELRLRPLDALSQPQSSDAGRSNREPDDLPLPLRVVAFEVPPELNGGTSGLGMAVAGGARPYRRPLLEAKIGGTVDYVPGPLREGVIGEITTELRSGPSGYLDLANVIDVQVGRSDWMAGASDTELFGGANLALVGEELLQFGSIMPLGEGRYRLSRLIRGRYNSASSDPHPVGTRFVLLTASSYSLVPITPGLIGADVSVRVLAAGSDDVEAATVIKAPFVHPLAPAHLQAAWMGSSLQLSWIRKSRSGTAWIDHVDAPLGEAVERYLLTLEGADASEIELSCDQPTITVSEEALAVLGDKPWRVKVRQVGDFGLSQECALTISEVDDG